MEGKNASDSTCTVIGTGDPIEDKNKMEFRLLYSGKLKGASKKDARPEMKHALRQAFHPQLRRLWSTTPALLQLAMRSSDPYFEKHPEIDRTTITGDKEKWINAGLEAISYNWERVGYHFVPLVTESSSVRCKIDILFLRPDEPRHVMQSGDLDAKLKTIFDALRLPSNLEETGKIGPQDDEVPFFCLLADDKLISQVSINADQLLVLPNERQVDPNDAFLIIHVQINHKNAGTLWFNIFD